MIEDDFVGKNNYYGKLKKDKTTPSKNNSEDIFNSIVNPVNKRTSIIDSFSKDDDVFNLSNRNIGNFYDQLQEAINKKSPMFLWSKERQNNKIRLDNEYQLLILEKIKNLRAISDEYNRLQADEIFSGEFIRNLVANKRMEAEHFFEDAVASHRVGLTKMKVDIDLTNSLVDHDQIEKDRKIAENERIRLENKEKEARIDDIKSVTKMRDKFTENFDPSTIDPKHISRVVLNTIMPNSNNIDIEFDDKMNENLYESEKAKADLLKRQAEEQQIKVDELKERKKWNDKKRGKL